MASVFPNTKQFSPDGPGRGSPDGNPEVAQLLSLQESGKWKQAVELAKQQHKKYSSPDSEHRLVDAYLGRIAQFQAKGSPEDARTLLRLVEERYPSHKSRFGALQVASAAATGDLETLVAPLARADVAVELRESIDSAIRVHVTDPAGLAQVRSLPAEHPLRVAAAAVHLAFAAVTAGPVTDEQIALPEVSRKSPLADWKLLIRAIAFFYRNDDEGCRRALSAISPDAVAGRLSPVLLGVIDRKACIGLTGALQARIAGDNAALREQMADFDDAVDAGSVRLNLVPRILQTCAVVRPEFWRSCGC